MSKKRKYIPKSFESTGTSSDTSANIYKSMLLSPAWKSLSKGAQNLYLYMKSQYYGVATKGHPDGDSTKFHFNKCLYVNQYGANGTALYNNDSTFRKNRDELVKNGFIRVVSDGSVTRERSVYEYSDKWKDYGIKEIDIPIKDMPLSMQRKIKSS